MFYLHCTLTYMRPHLLKYKEWVLKKGVGDTGAVTKGERVNGEGRDRLNASKLLKACACAAA